MTNNGHDDLDDLFFNDAVDVAVTACDLTSSDFDTNGTSEVLSEEEDLYLNGPSGSAPTRNKRGRGRPTKEEVKRRQVRDRVRRFRAKKPAGIWKYGQIT